MTRKLKLYNSAFIQMLHLSICIMTSTVAADSSKKQPNSVFCGAKNEMALISTRPIREMDDEQLYASANQILNQNMSAHQRVLNYHWLHQGTHNTLLGSKAVEKLLRFGFGSYWQNNNKWTNENNRGPLLETLSLFSQWGNYRLGATNDSIALKYRINF